MAGLRDLKEVRGLLAKDLAVLALREGLDLPPTDDPMLLAYLLDPSNTTPEGVARRYGGEWREEAAHRALLAERLQQNLLERLKGEEKLLWLYREVEKPLSRVLATWRPPGSGWTWLPEGPFPGASGGDKAPRGGGLPPGGPPL